MDKYTISEDCGIYVNGKFLFSVSPIPFMPSDERNEGESWLDMRERTEKDREAAYDKARRIANYIFESLEKIDA